MQPILEVRNLSKRYKIKHLSTRYFSFRERMLSLLKLERSVTEEFYAVNDMSFEIQAGQSVGIIGRNGAGKSTLLKLLSKITFPTKGKIISRGRVASLLEVGTGFHPELTGRENIYFNGSLLGMKRREIDSKFDSIVDFSGVERFLDTPLKHYSSGMQLRMAFSVAAFLEPEILIIDEVLAVGDAEFQKKCIGKMEDVGKSGRTILFVSHNLPALKTLCPHAILLDKGKIIEMGETHHVVNRYLSNIEFHSGGVFDFSTHHSKRNALRGITRGRLLREGQPSDIFYSNEKFTIELDFIDDRPINEIVLGLVIKDLNQQPLIGITNWDLGIRLNSTPIKDGRIFFEIEALPLYGDSVYYVDLYFGDGGDNYDFIENAMTFKLEPIDVFKNGKVLNPRINVLYPGKVNMVLEGQL